MNGRLELKTTRLQVKRNTFAQIVGGVAADTVDDNRRVGGNIIKEVIAADNRNAEHGCPNAEGWVKDTGKRYARRQQGINHHFAVPPAAYHINRLRHQRNNPLCLIKVSIFNASRGRIIGPGFLALLLGELGAPNRNLVEQD